MGYLFLSIALFAGLTKGFCGKKMGNYAANVQSASLLNMIRMLLCILFGMIIILINNEARYLAPTPEVLLISAISGVSTSVFVVSWLVSIRKSAYLMVEIFLMLGTIVPMLTGYFWFSEGISIAQWIGFVILLVAVALMCSYNNSIKIKITLPSLLVVALCGFINGVTGVTQKMFVKTVSNVPVSIFNFYTYVFAAITLGIYLCLSIGKEKPKFSEDERHSKYRKYVYIVIMALALILNSYFNTLAASYLDSARLFPLRQGAALILSTFMAAVMFGEKPTLKSILGIILAFVGLLIMNLL